MTKEECVVLAKDHLAKFGGRGPVTYPLGDGGKLTIEAILTPINVWFGTAEYSVNGRVSGTTFLEPSDNPDKGMASAIMKVTSKKPVPSFLQERMGSGRMGSA